ncbi:MAG: CIA30 family protein [Spirochaetales bacterium]|nr:CIA30 family protein [Spirochaetales bacterium]
MKKLINLVLIILVISMSVVIQGCVSSSQPAADTVKKETDPVVEWDGTTKIEPESAYYYDDLNDGGSSTNLGTFEDGKLILKGSVTTQFQYGFIGAGFLMTEDFKKLLIVTQGIKFTAKGDGKSYRCRFDSRKVTDYDHFGYVFQTTEGEEKEIVILYDQLSQEGWGKAVTFHPKDVNQISFQTIGQPHENVYLEVSDLEIIPPEN